MVSRLQLLAFLRRCVEAWQPADAAELLAELERRRRELTEAN